LHAAGQRCLYSCTRNSLPPGEFSDVIVNDSASHFRDNIGFMEQDSVCLFRSVLEDSDVLIQRALSGQITGT